MSFDALVHSTLRRIRHATSSVSDGENAPYQANTSKLGARLWDVFSRTYDLGFVAFGGPPVHFQILHKRFVEGQGKTPWLDEQTVRVIKFPLRIGHPLIRPILLVNSTKSSSL